MMWRAALFAALVSACGVPKAPPVPDGYTTGAGNGDDDTAAACDVCTLIACEDDSPPDEVASELDCEEAAGERGCEDWEWERC